MIEEAPDPKEVSNFYFKQLKTLKLAKANEAVPQECVNVIAASSKYGLLFVGIQNGFKILKFENILDVDEDKENRRIEENYFGFVVPSQTPSLLSLSSDEKTLAVLVSNSMSLVANMYDIAAFADLDMTSEPFLRVPLSTNSGTTLKEFIWNPAVDSIYAYCLSDGSLHVHELDGMNLKVVASLSPANATAACWSPKGKQLVVGKADGTFSQYKPTLQEVKSVPAPKLGENALSVVSICWISTTLFAVGYVPQGDFAAPNLVMVSTPKGKPVVYTNFYDVCFGSGSKAQKYFLHYEAAWGILLCGSTDSIDIAVIGDPPNWVPWDLREDGKAILPGKDGASHAIGMGVMYCSQRRIVISDTEFYGPMPVIFVLTDNGLLVSYHMINTAADAISLVCPSTPIETDGERKRMVRLHRSIPASEVPSQPSAGFTPFQSIPQSQPVAFTHFAPQPPSANIIPGGEEEKVHKAAKGMSAGLSSNRDEASGIRQVAVAQRTASALKTVQDAVPVSSAKQAPVPHPEPVSTLKEKEENISHNTYIAAILEEMQNFEKELQDLKQSTSQTFSIGSKEEMADLKSQTLNLQDFQNDMTETMKSLNNDIHSLKSVLLELFVLVEEAHSREKRRKDHLYLSMLRERALDPSTANQMQKIERHYHYLGSQLREVNDRLDRDWSERQQDRNQNRRAVRHVSSTETIYKTIVNNQNVIHNLRKKTDYLSNKLAAKKTDTISKKQSWSRYSKRSEQEDIAKLADAFLQAKITNAEEEEHPVTKTISPEDRDLLKTFLVNCHVSTVRPTVVYFPSQSRLISKSLLYREAKTANEGSDKVDAVTLNANASSPNMSGKTAEMNPPFALNKSPYEKNVQVSKPEATKTLSAAQPTNHQGMYSKPEPFKFGSAYSIQNLMSSSSSSENICASNAPVYEAINPPESSSPICDEAFSAASMLSGQTRSSVSVSTQSKESATVSKTDSQVVPTSAPATVATTSPKIVDVSSIDLPPSSLPATSLPYFTFLTTSTTSSFASTTTTSTPAASTTSAAVVLSTSSSVVTTSASVVVPQVPRTTAPTRKPSAAVPLGVALQLEATKPASVSEAPAVTSPSSLFAKSAVSSAPALVFGSSATTTTAAPSLFGQPNSQPADFAQPTTIRSLGAVTTSTSAPAASTTVATTSAVVVLSNSLSVVTTSIVVPQVPQTTAPTSQPPAMVPLAVASQVEATKPASVSEAPAVTAPSSLFAQSAASSAPALVFGSSATTKTTAAPSLFGQPNSQPANFAQPTTIGSFGAVTTSPPVFSQNTNTTSFFGSPATTQSSFGVPATTQTSFGASTTSQSSFGSPATTQSSFFGKAGDASLFGQAAPATQQSTFGQQAGPLGQGASTFFSQPSSNQSPGLGTDAANESSSFANQSSNSGFFSKPVFGQTASSFRLAKSVFGQNPTFSQAGATSSVFGQSSGGGFGQGSFFSGLGGKPSAENASKNVFGGGNVEKSSTESSIFGNSGASTYGTKPGGTFSGGSFSGSGSVSQFGFGAFQEASQKTAFGSAPSFRSSVGFGSPPAFGSTSPVGGSVFGGQQTPNFSNFAASNSPTFGSLASQTPGFGSPPPQQPQGGSFGQQGSPFGAAPVFGNASMFGQQSSFGSPSSPSGNSAFSHWRS